MYKWIIILGLLAITADQLELRNDCDGHRCETTISTTEGK